MQDGLVEMYIGVDGGGSRCRVRICDPSGRVVGAAEGGSANVYLAFDTALHTIRETVETALKTNGLSLDWIGRSAIGLGLAGMSGPQIATRIATALDDFAETAISNDGVTACLGAHAGGDGGLVIAGTGSAAVLRLDGQEINFGGRGFILGDDGSGAIIGRDAFRKALRAYDGLEPQTPLLRDLMVEFADDPVALITWGRSATSGQFGAYTPKIVAAATAGDPAGIVILTTAGQAIGELISVLAARGAPRISLVGGLAAPLAPYLPVQASALLQPPLQDALDGALILAGAPRKLGDRR